MAFLHTYSIVARDEESGQFGVAVQSHWFAVGSLCPWVEAGVGAIATQSMVEPAYGPRGLDALRSGKPADQVLQELLAQDKGRELRQVAIVDASGQVAVHTGTRCISAAGHQSGSGYSVQANMMMNARVWPEMAAAFEKAQGDLSLRMLAALQAAQTAGGDIRGQQSACMLIADGVKSDKPWEHLLVDIRVDDSPKPLVELERLLNIQRAYELMNQGDALLAKDEMKAAQEKYGQAAALAPKIDEIPFWQAVTLADIGKVEEALPIFAQVFNQNPNWAELVQRLPACGLLRDDPQMMRQILSIQIKS
jgi:uncharacterized Ntn-hydrolase superfamily protein